MLGGRVSVRSPLGMLDKPASKAFQKFEQTWNVLCVKNIHVAWLQRMIHCNSVILSLGCDPTRLPEGAGSLVADLMREFLGAATEPHGETAKASFLATTGDILEQLRVRLGRIRI